MYSTSYTHQTCIQIDSSRTGIQRLAWNAGQARANRNQIIKNAFKLDAHIIHMEVHGNVVVEWERHDCTPQAPRSHDSEDFILVLRKQMDF